MKKEVKSDKINIKIQPSVKAKWQRVARRKGVSLARLIEYSVERVIDSNS